MKSSVSVRLFIAAVCSLLSAAGLTFAESTTTIDFRDYTTSPPYTDPDSFEIFSKGYAFSAAANVVEDCGGVPCLALGPHHGVTQLYMFPFSSKDTYSPSGVTFTLFSFEAAEPVLSIPGRGVGTPWLEVDGVNNGKSETFQLTDKLTAFNLDFSDKEMLFLPFYRFSDGSGAVGAIEITDLLVTNLNPTPEPTTLFTGILGFALVGLVVVCRRRQPQSSTRPGGS